jgi:hypothetical protein
MLDECNINDAKHTNNKEQGCGKSVMTTDQAGLFKAAIDVQSSVKVAVLVLGDVHLQFVTSRGSLTIPKASIEASRKLDATK